VEPKKISEAEYQRLSRDYCGICLKCGEIREGDTEPDAEDYECASCGEHAVQGIDNALIAGNITISED
jgi:hypothetical protein